MARITTDMSDHNLYLFAFEKGMLSEQIPDRSSVYISINPPGLAEVHQGFGYPASEIAGMPNFLAGLKVREDPFVEEPMRIAENADAGHVDYLKRMATTGSIREAI